MDIADATDTELHQLKRLIDTELERRQTLASTGAKMEALAADYLQAAGVKPGDEWKQPTSAVDAYPKDWTVTYNGSTWLSLTPANVWEPGVSGWREIVEDGDAPPEWVQPTGAHDAYNTGDIVTFEGAVYKSVIDANTWSPDDYSAGWEKVE